MHYSICILRFVFHALEGFNLQFSNYVSGNYLLLCANLINRQYFHRKIGLI